jgi:plastocyanin
VFWGGPVLAAGSTGHSGRLIVSYAFIPVAVAVVLLWKKKWEWATFAYYTLGIALIKMVVTMGIFIGAPPRRAAGNAKPIDMLVGTARTDATYRAIETDRWGFLKGRVSLVSSTDQAVAVITNVSAGKKQRRLTHRVSVTGHSLSPTTLLATVGDSLIVTNNDNEMHTFNVTGEGGALLQLPLAPGKSSPPQLLTRQGWFDSHCAQGHDDEVMQLVVFGHPYYETVRDGGTFEFDSIPAGRYVVALYDLTRNATGTQPESLAHADFGIVAAETAWVELSVQENKP